VDSRASREGVRAGPVEAAIGGGVTLRTVSVCSGIAAPEVAWKPLGWQPQSFSEIDPFACALLAARHPGVPNIGDMEKVTDDEAKRFAPDVVVAGTPCQSFSVAGLRGGMADPRGNLALVLLRLVDAARPRWLVWENVPGVLSSNDGRDFGAFLGGLGQLGYGFAYRVLDAQYFGVPQRRRRVFVVGHLGDWRPAAAVLFERHSLSGHPAPSREAGQRVTGSLAARTSAGGGLGTDFDCGGGLVASTGETAHCLNAGGMGRQDYETETLVAQVTGTLATGGDGHAYPGTSAQDASQGFLVAHALRADGFDASEDGTGRGTPLVPWTVMKQQNYVAFAGMAQAGAGWAPPSCPTSENIALPLDTKRAQAIAYDEPLTHQGIKRIICAYANATQARSDQVLRLVREAVGSEADAERFAGELAAFWTPEVLRSDVHGERLHGAIQGSGSAEAGAVSGEDVDAQGAVRDVRRNHAAARRSSPRRKSAQQRSRESDRAVPVVPSEGASPARCVCHLWATAEGTRLLQQTLHSLEAVWRPADGARQAPAVITSNKAAPSHMAVRRLTPIECELLMGFPRNYTAIDYRGKPAADGPRYRALGNSIAVPVLRWIGERIEMVEALRKGRAA
jgi:DNA (cytosine-5)-methyltransferase 1